MSWNGRLKAGILSAASQEDWQLHGGNPAIYGKDIELDEKFNGRLVMAKSLVGLEYIIKNTVENERRLILVLLIDRQQFSILHFVPILLYIYIYIKYYF